MLPHFPVVHQFGENVCYPCLCGTVSDVMVLSVMALQMKWKQRSMCFILAWKCPSFDRTMVEWLSQFSVMGMDSGHMISLRNYCSHRASFMSWAVAMYSVLVVDRVTTSFFSSSSWSCLHWWGMCNLIWSAGDIVRCGVTSCKTHMTLLTNLSQFWTWSHLPHHSHA